MTTYDGGAGNDLVGRAGGSGTIRVLCVPQAGAGAASINGFRRSAPDGFEVRAIRFAGRENRLQEPPPQSMDQFVDDALAMLAGFRASGPLWLIGQCSGAWIAYELALKLRKRAVPVDLLACVSAPAPSMRNPAPQSDRDLQEVVMHQGVGGATLPQPERELLLELLLPQLRADYAALAAYEPAPSSYEGSALVLAGADDSNISEEALRSWSRHLSNPAFRRPRTGFVDLGAHPALVWDELRAARRALA